MKNKNETSEQTILDAAEQVFLDKGYAAARTTEIANLAGVNHSMLHYYYRSKEELFNKVFDNKVHLMIESFSFILEENLPFLEKMRLFVEIHFDFLLANPKLPLFIINEVLINPERKSKVKEIFVPKFLNLYDRLNEQIASEIAKGTIVNISAMDLMLNIVALNAASNIAAMLIFENQEEALSRQAREEFLHKRKTATVEFILRSIKV